ncbi:hypothetical protein C8R43DRAFT_942834 [Mycena crocata]|nr:hypothetical protein C8R43DRAFT_942834 [Mycena crocata]
MKELACDIWMPRQYWLYNPGRLRDEEALAAALGWLMLFEVDSVGKRGGFLRQIPLKSRHRHGHLSEPQPIGLSSGPKSAKEPLYTSKRHYVTTERKRVSTIDRFWTRKETVDEAWMQSDRMDRSQDSQPPSEGKRGRINHPRLVLYGGVVEDEEAWAQESLEPLFVHGPDITLEGEGQEVHTLRFEDRTVDLDRPEQRQGGELQVVKEAKEMAAVFTLSVAHGRRTAPEGQAESLKHEPAAVVVGGQGIDIGLVCTIRSQRGQRRQGKLLQAWARQLHEVEQRLRRKLGVDVDRNELGPRNVSPGVPVHPGFAGHREAAQVRGVTETGENTNQGVARPCIVHVEADPREVLQLTGDGQLGLGRYLVGELEPQFADLGEQSPDALHMRSRRDGCLQVEGNHAGTVQERERVVEIRVTACGGPVEIRSVPKLRCGQRHRPPERTDLREERGRVVCHGRRHRSDDLYEDERQKLGGEAAVFASGPTDLEQHGTRRLRHFFDSSGQTLQAAKVLRTYTEVILPTGLVRLQRACGRCIWWDVARQQRLQLTRAPVRRLPRVIRPPINAGPQRSISAESAGDTSRYVSEPERCRSGGGKLSFELRAARMGDGSRVPEKKKKGKKLSASTVVYTRLSLGPQPGKRAHCRFPTGRSSRDECGVGHSDAGQSPPPVAATPHKGNGTPARRGGASKETATARSRQGPEEELKSERTDGGRDAPGAQTLPASGRRAGTDDAVTAPQSTKQCRLFNKGKQCPKGSACEFCHESTTDVAGGGGSPAPKKTQRKKRSFWRRSGQLPIPAAKRRPSFTTQPAERKGDEGLNDASEAPSPPETDAQAGRKEGPLLRRHTLSTPTRGMTRGETAMAREARRTAAEALCIECYNAPGRRTLDLERETRPSPHDPRFWLHTVPVAKVTQPFNTIDTGHEAGRPVWRTSRRIDTADSAQRFFTRTLRELHRASGPLRGGVEYRRERPYATLQKHRGRDKSQLKPVPLGERRDLHKKSGPEGGGGERSIEVQASEENEGLHDAADEKSAAIGGEMKHAPDWSWTRRGHK